MDQLGNEKEPVRLGAPHSLVRLAQNNLDQRQTIVDVICAYLRMPYTPPDDKAPAEDAPSKAHTRYEQRRQELQVRLTAQRVLAAHLRPDVTDDVWADIDLDLTEAYLHRFDLTGCRIKSAQFDGARFSGPALFEGTHFGENARFRAAHFHEVAMFYGAHFCGDALFDGAVEFCGNAVFRKAHFDGETSFMEARFGGWLFIQKAIFGDSAEFIDARFVGSSVFDDATFDGGDAYFIRAKFSKHAIFNDVQFRGYVDFAGARARPHLGHLWPVKWSTRDARIDEGEKEGWVYLVRVEDSA